MEPGKLVFADDDLRIQLHGAIEHCRTDTDDGKEDDENSVPKSLTFFIALVDLS